MLPCFAVMKLHCDVEVVNRMLPTFGVKSKGRGYRAVLSIGKHVDKTTQRANVYLLICTAKDRAGSKYKASVFLFKVSGLGFVFTLPNHQCNERLFSYSLCVTALNI